MRRFPNGPMMFPFFQKLNLSMRRDPKDSIFSSCQSGPFRTLHLDLASWSWFLHHFHEEESQRPNLLMKRRPKEYMSSRDRKTKPLQNRGIGPGWNRSRDFWETRWLALKENWAERIESSFWHPNFKTTGFCKAVSCSLAGTNCANGIQGGQTNLVPAWIASNFWRRHQFQLDFPWTSFHHFQEECIQILKHQRTTND